MCVFGMIELLVVLLTVSEYAFSSVWLHDAHRLSR